MKKLIEKIFAVIIAAVLVLSVCGVSAYADEKILVNGKEVKPGDTVTFEYYVGGINDAVAAAGAYITYDPKCLKYVDESIGFDVFNNAMFSVGDGTIYYAAVNSLYGYDLKEKKLAVSLSFEVLDSAKGSTSVKHSFDEFFTIKDESTDIDSSKYDDEAKLTVNSYNGVNSSPFLGVDANSSSPKNDSSQTVSDILGGNPNSNVTVSSGNSVSSSTVGNISSSGSTSVGGSGNSENSESNSDLPSQSNALASENGSSDQTALSSAAAGTQNSNVSSDLEEDKNDGGAGIVVIICVLFVVLCAGAVLYFTNSKKNRE